MKKTVTAWLTHILNKMYEHIIGQKKTKQKT